MKRYLAITILLQIMFSLLPLTTSGIMIAMHQTLLSYPPSEFDRCDTTSAHNNNSQVMLHCQLTPSDDSYVDNFFPQMSFGNELVLIVQNVPSIPSYKNYAYLKFNTEKTIPSQIILTRAKPFNASLRMYVEYINLFYNATIEIHRVPSSDWNEQSLNWNNRPPYEMNNSSQIRIRLNDTYVNWNVTAIAQESLRNGTAASFAAVASERSWRNYVWFASKDYPLNNGFRWPVLDLFYAEPILTITTPFSHSTIMIDDAKFLTNENGVFSAPFPWGEHTVTVPNTISIGNGERASFVNWSDNSTGTSRVVTLGNNLTLAANYKTQYEMTLSSQYGSPLGSGWYYEGSNANISVQPTNVPFNGWAGYLGARHVFDHWTGVCTISEANCSILMSGPKTATAIWRDDYTLSVAITAFACALVGFSALARHKRISRQRARKQRSTA